MPSSYNIGFGGGGYRGNDSGLFGGLGRSVGAAMSPNAGGPLERVGAFLNPGPTLERDRQQAETEALKAVFRKYEPQINNAMKLLELGNPTEATQIISQVGMGMQQEGIDPNKAVLPYFERIKAAYEQAQLRSLDPNAPNFGSGLMKGATDIGQGVQIGEMLSRNALTSTQQQAAQQGMQQSAELFPYKKEEARLAPLATQSGMETEAARRGYIGQQGQALSGQMEGQGIANEQAAMERDFFRQHQMKPGTAGTGGAGRDYFDDEQRIIQLQDQLMADAQKEPPMGGAPPTAEELNERAKPVNEAIRELKRRMPGREGINELVFEQGQPEQRRDPKYEGRGEAPMVTIPGRPRGRYVSGGQQQGPMTQLPQSEVQQLGTTMTDQDVDAAQVQDPQTMEPAQRAIYDRINQETQAGYKRLQAQKATPEQIRQYQREQARKLIAALTSGGQ